jgi:hypothetical protein
VSKRDRAPDKTTSARDPGGSRGRGTRAALCASLLAAVSEGVERQRAAVLASDPTAVTRSFDSLAPLLADLTVISAAGGELDGSASGLASLARQVREQIQTNQTLIANGIAITDHYALCVAEASPTISPALFSEVA